MVQLLIALRDFATRMSGETLFDLKKPTDVAWEPFTVATLEAALVTQQPVLFDLTHVLDIEHVLNGTGRYAATITGYELRYLRAHWTRFQSVVQFYENDEMREPPW